MEHYRLQFMKRMNLLTFLRAGILRLQVELGGLIGNCRNERQANIDSHSTPVRKWVLYLGSLAFILIILFQGSR